MLRDNSESRSRMTLRYMAICEVTRKLGPADLWTGRNACYAVLALDRVSAATFSDSFNIRQASIDLFGILFGYFFDLTSGVEPEADWQPIPLELPLDDPYRRPPAPVGGEHNPDPDGDAGSHVIIIDLA